MRVTVAKYGTVRLDGKPIGSVLRSRTGEWKACAYRSDPSMPTAGKGWFNIDGEFRTRKEALAVVVALATSAV